MLLKAIDEYRFATEIKRQFPNDLTVNIEFAKILYNFVNYYIFSNEIPLAEKEYLIMREVYKNSLWDQNVALFYAQASFNLILQAITAEGAFITAFYLNNILNKYQIIKNIFNKNPTDKSIGLILAMHAKNLIIFNVNNYQSNIKHNFYWNVIEDKYEDLNMLVQRFSKNILIINEKVSAIPSLMHIYGQTKQLNKLEDKFNDLERLYLDFGDDSNVKLQKALSIINKLYWTRQLPKNHTRVVLLNKLIELFQKNINNPLWLNYVNNFRLTIDWESRNK